MATRATSPTARAIANALGLDESYWRWLASLEAEGYVRHAVPPLAPVPSDEAAHLLERLGCGPKAIADTVATLPDPERDPERWWLLERCHRQAVTAMGDFDSNLSRFDPELVRFPSLPTALGVAGGCFPIHVFVATVPAVRAWHGARGVPGDVSWATLVDLGRHVAIEQRWSGQTGVDAPWWMMWHVRGAIFEVGSLQYTPYHVGGPVDPSPWYDKEEARRLGPGFLPGDLSFGIHIPAGAPLDRQSCSESMYSARRLFDDIFPTQGRRVATCSSWLLDDQPAAYLPAESNIVRFQQMFSLVPGWGDADASVVHFVFRNQGLPPDAAQASTRLQRAVLVHLDAGGHFRCRTGWCDLPPEPAA